MSRDANSYLPESHWVHEFPEGYEVSTRHDASVILRLASSSWELAQAVLFRAKCAAWFLKEAS